MSGKSSSVKYSAIALIISTVVYLGILSVIELTWLTYLEFEGVPSTILFCCIIPFWNALVTGICCLVLAISARFLTKRFQAHKWRPHLIIALVLFLLSLLGNLTPSPWWLDGDWGSNMLLVIFFGGLPILLVGPLYFVFYFVSTRTI